MIIGATEQGHKELLAIQGGHRESKESWLSLLLDLKNRGLVCAPKLSVGDGALGFWGALTEVYGETRHQRCWFHKMGNVLDKLPKSLQPQAKKQLQEIWMSDKRETAYKAFDSFIKTYESKYLKATDCLQKDKEELLAFYDFPAEQWSHLRTTNPIESTFATVRHRTYKSKGAFSRTTILTMVFKLCQSAEKRWLRLRGFNYLAEVIQGVKFTNGIHLQMMKETLGNVEKADIEASDETFALIVQEIDWALFSKGTKLIFDPKKVSKHRHYVLISNKDVPIVSFYQILFFDGTAYLKPPQAEYKTIEFDKDKHSIKATMIQARMDQE